MTHLDLGGDEERRDAEQLQKLLTDVFLRQHEAVKEVLSQVRRLPVEAVHLAHLHTNTVCTRDNVHVRGRREAPPSPPAASPAGWPSSWAAGWGVAAGNSCHESTSGPCSAC